MSWSPQPEMALYSSSMMSALPDPMQLKEKPKDKSKASGNKRKATQCGHCFAIGHNVRTCPSIALPPNKLALNGPPSKKARKGKPGPKPGSKKLGRKQGLRKNGHKQRSKRPSIGNDGMMLMDSGDQQKEKKPKQLLEATPMTTWPAPCDRINSESRHFPAKTDKTGCTWCAARRPNRHNTKYMCEICKVALCPSPCFREFHTVR